MAVALLLSVGGDAQTLIAAFPDVTINDIASNYGGSLPGSCCQHILINPNTNRAYELDDPGMPGPSTQITVIDLANNMIVAVIPIPFQPFVMVLNTRTNRIYIPVGDGLIYVVDGNTNQAGTVSLTGVGGIHFAAVDSVRNRVYLSTDTSIVVLDGSTNQVLGISANPTSNLVGRPCGALAVNNSTGRVYLPLELGIGVFNPATGQVAVVPTPAGFFPICGLAGIALNSVTDRAYMPGQNYGDPSNPASVAVFDGSTMTFYNTPIPLPGVQVSDGVPDGITGIAVDSQRNRVYITADGYGPSLIPQALVTLFGDTNTVSIFDLTSWQASLGGTFQPLGGVALDPSANRLYISGFNNGSDPGCCDFDNPTLIVVDPDSTPTSSGSNVVVQTDALQLTYPAVNSSGTTSVTPIDPATVGQVPGGFSVSGTVAYEVQTTAAFSGLVTIAFHVPGPISQADFSNLRILHNVSGTLVDVTASSPAPDYSSLTIYATTASFSPFYLARLGQHIAPLFDESAAHKSGSTVPIKLQLLDGSNTDVSSSSNFLIARGLTRIGDATALTVSDSGNANPDSAFRYDSTLNGYVFNLSTKGLSAGSYVLSFYEAGKPTFLYTATFQVR